MRRRSRADAAAACRSSDERSAPASSILRAIDSASGQQDEQQQGRTSQGERQQGPDLGPGLGLQPGNRDVQLEKQGLPGPVLEPEVDLGDLAHLCLEDVLRTLQRGELGGRPESRQQGGVLRLELEATSDEPLVVRPDDLAVRGPDLDPHQRAVGHPCRHDRVEPVQGLGVPVAQGVVGHGGDDRLGDVTRRSLRVPEDLAPGRLLRDDDGPGEHRQQGDEAEDGEAGKGRPDLRPAPRRIGADDVGSTSPVSGRLIGGDVGEGARSLRAAISPCRGR